MTGNPIEKIKSRVLVDGFEIVPDLEKSHGAIIYDKNSGREMLDLGYNQFGSLTLGYNHPAMKDPDYLKKLMAASDIRWALSDLYPEYYGEFVEAFKSIVPDDYIHFFFVDGGAPAVENGLKVAFDWKTRKNIAEKDIIPGDKVLHFRQAFHGRLGYTLSLTNTADPNKYRFFPKFDWPRVHNPKAKFSRDGSVEYDDEERAIWEIEDAIYRNENRIAAIIIEPIQGEGGDNYFSPDFFQFLREVADENDIMLMFDEVQTGWATGEWWAFQHLTGGVKPDIFSFGKKVQQCGIAVNSRVDEVEENVFRVSSRINSTWGGTLLDMVRSTRYMEVIKKERLLENSKKQGERIKKALLDEAPEYVTNIRGIAGWIAFTLPSKDIRDELWKKLYAEGAMLLKSGVESLRMRPNLAISDEEVDMGLERLFSAMKKIS